MYFRNDIKSVGSSGSSLHKRDSNSGMGRQPLSTFLPHIENGSSRTCSDLDTNPAHVMKTSPCLVNQNAGGASNITARRIPVASGGLWEFDCSSMNHNIDHGVVFIIRVIIHVDSMPACSVCETFTERPTPTQFQVWLERVETGMSKKRGKLPRTLEYIDPGGFMLY